MRAPWCARVLCGLSEVWEVWEIPEEWELRERVVATKCRRECALMLVG